MGKRLPPNAGQPFYLAEWTTPKNGCHPVTLTAFEAVLYATASREFHSNPVPLKMAPELYESTGLWQTVPLKQGADVHARGPCHSVTLALGQGDNGMSPCHPAVTLVFDFATKSFCA